MRSFTGLGLEYTVAVDVERSLLLSCTCADYVKHKIPCKHMYLVARLFDVFEICYTPDREPPQDDNVDNGGDGQDGHDAMDDNDPPVQAFVPLNVQLLLQAERAKEREARKRKHEEEVAEAFKDCDARLKEIWVTMGNYIIKDVNRKCTLDYMRATVATLENACRDLKGVNEIGAGRRCQ